jgi:copper chaperone CopZ
MTLRKTIVLSALFTTLGVISGCGTGGAPSAGSSSSGAPVGREGITHRVSAAEAATAHGSTPIAGEYAKMWVNGMGCPQCVTNIDLQLERQLGASDLKVDLKEGVVYARFAKDRPTPDQISKATDDAGLTLAKMEVSKSPFGAQ